VFFVKQDILSDLFVYFSVKTPINAGIAVIFGFLNQMNLARLLLDYRYIEGGYYENSTY